MLSARIDLVLQARGKIIPKLSNVHVTISKDEVHIEAFDLNVTPLPGWLRIGTYDSVRRTFTEFLHNPETHKEQVA